MFPVLWTEILAVQYVSVDSNGWIQVVLQEHE